jgi:hypothetical protein
VNNTRKKIDANSQTFFIMVDKDIPKMRAPVKSHTLTGACRTHGTEKYWHKILYINCAAWTGFRVIFFENHRVKKDDKHCEWFYPEWHPPKWDLENGDASRSLELEKQSVWPFC